jgi:GTP diphosphokinase / guanosine-3',5'-bis(diphosphate) 3'-diphosphatase
LDIASLINKIQTYHPGANTALVQKAYDTAFLAHQGQKRISGDDYIQHPLGVANILVDLQLDVETIAAGLLHDVVEDTAISIESMEKLFGKEIALLVDGVTKLSRINFKNKEEQQLESLRKMFMAMAKDIRVILIKLADRLHNMRTLKYMAPEKQKEISRETLEIFAPLAHRLGMSGIKWELEDLCFRFLEPDRYYELTEKVKQKRREREAIVNEAIKSLRDKLDAVGIRGEIQGRPKHFYSIHKKMIRQGKDLSDIYDLYAIRVVVESIKDCYGVLGIVHTLWKPLPGRFKDYIATPKSNMYQSLHTTVVGSNGEPVEIQIRTLDMHRTSEYGIAAHWRYKEGGKGEKDFEDKLSWLRQLLDWQQDMKDAREFMETLKMDVFSDEVFVFTPKGDVLDLPAGSNPIDFAYRIHTGVGHRCVGAKVNGRIVPIDYKLNNGDIVEIITSKQTNGPSRDWLNIVRSSDTKNKIRQWFKKEKREENVIKGRETLERESKKQGYDFSELIKNDRLADMTRRFNFNNEDDMFAAIGYGGLTTQAVLVRLLDAYRREQKIPEPDQISQILADLKPKHGKNRKSGHGVLVEGEPDLLVRLSKCCNPIPGDQIVGYITRGRGVSIHRADCSNALHHRDENERMVDVQWDTSGANFYQVSIEVTVVDRPGALSDILAAVAETRTNVASVNAHTTKTKLGIITLVFEIGNLAQLEMIIQKIRRVQDVYSVNRAQPSQVGE